MPGNSDELRCAECGATPDERAVTVIGIGECFMIKTPACLKHWPPGSLTHDEWIQHLL